MVVNVRLTMSVVAAVLMFATAGVPAAEPATASQNLTGLKTAVLPLKDYTDNSRAYGPVTESIRAGLTRLAIPFVSPQELRPILRQHRIRAAGHIAPAEAEAVSEGVDADLLLVGSIDFYRDVDNLECGLSLRLVSPDDMTVLSSVSLAATARDQVGLFGRGAIDSIADLIPRVTDEALTRLYRPWLHPHKSRPARISSEPIVVLPLENISDNRHAGNIAADWLLSVLVDQGYPVVEPGAVIELMLPAGGVPVGQIDTPRLRIVRDSLGAGLVVTGEVDRFRPARSLSPGAKPEFAFGLHITDAASGVVVAAFNAERDGGESETVFGLGRRHALGTLMWSAFTDAVKKLKPQLVQFATGRP